MVHLGLTVLDRSAILRGIPPSPLGKETRAMATLANYAEKYQTIRMERRDGILQMTFHTAGQPLQWGELPHREFPQAFHDIASDPDNKVVIMTGTGDVFSGPRATPDARLRRSAAAWDKTYWEGKHLLWNLLDIEVPMISAINGPALRHSELPLLCDIVLAAEETTFQDSAHFTNGMVPGDGMHILYPLLMGLNRGRYFLLTGQTLTARQAQEVGLVNEVLPRQELLPRAWALAEQLAQRPPLVLRYSRVLLTQHLKRLMHDLLGYGLALEGLGVAAES
jgi:enoyl-CoA hydratase/carnithine racemase